MADRMSVSNCERSICGSCGADVLVPRGSRETYRTLLEARFEPKPSSILTPGTDGLWRVVEGHVEHVCD